eukprot:CAMPEP_0183379422 /NCGR_PEP_ID=MMETSP0164_2-20130417/125418_1 /TAXON_ID=221442 /ORGANISM="Coccolithus pelagicus ssp braarudi, Strain PLY182g" /LENGTH=163 /DNA_ID=CAMNT_0025557005 /DNA_START=707 /DNA_END=1198 /DNA_ORIENTATION=-
MIRIGASVLQALCSARRCTTLPRRLMTRRSMQMLHACGGLGRTPTGESAPSCIGASVLQALCSARRAGSRRASGGSSLPPLCRRCVASSRWSIAASVEEGTEIPSAYASCWMAKKSTAAARGQSISRGHQDSIFGFVIPHRWWHHRWICGHRPATQVHKEILR